jgi:DNA-directed RNA polymerase specialized sigma24 family protein
MGDKMAFKMIYLRYYKEVEAYISKKCLSKAGLAETLQDVFVTVWTNRIGLANMVDFRNYVFQLADNCLQIYQLNRIKSSLQDEDLIDCSRDKDIQEGFEIVKNFELSSY